LWRDPDSLKPDSWAYERYVAWLRVYRRDKWKKRARSAKAHWRYAEWSRFRESGDWKKWYRPVRLTREDIVSLAVLNLVGGVMLLVAGVGLLVSDWFSR
jgi:hypothetical protein